MRRRGVHSWIALAALLALAAAFVWHETRSSTLWADEWLWALDRRGGGAGTFLEPHNEHLSLVPIALYKLLFATAGIDDYEPYRALVIAAHLTCVTLLFAYARPRVGALLALVVAAVLLFLGPAWQNILWPFQTGTLISLASGIGALLLLDRYDRVSDVGACGLLALALASSGLGIPVAIGVAVEVLSGRRGLRSAWIVAVPAAAYGLWWLAYQDTELVRHNLVVTPGYVADSAASSLSALAGLAGPPGDAAGTTLSWGRPLAVAAVAVLAWRLARPGVVSPRVVGLLAIAVSFWVLTGLRRAQISTPYESRYLYVGGLVLLLLAVELTRGAALSRRVLALVACVAAVAVLANLGDMRDGGRQLRAQAAQARAVLGALELARPSVAGEYIPTSFPGFPLVVIEAGPYFAAADALGSPAAGPEALATLPGEARLAADAELTRIGGAALEPGGAAAAAGPPAVAAVTGGTVEERGACVRFRPDAARAAGGVVALELDIPPDGLLLRAQGAAADVAVRRFAATFPQEPLGSVAPAGTATLRIAPDRASEPWRARIAPEAGMEICPPA